MPEAQNVPGHRRSLPESGQGREIPGVVIHPDGNGSAKEEGDRTAAVHGLT
jgi:hypothetical protein